MSLPHPVSRETVNDRVEHREQHVRLQLCALSHCPLNVTYTYMYNMSIGNE